MMIDEQKKTGRHEILVVDDTPASLQLLTRILTDHGYRVRPASDGCLALKSVAAKAPDMILLDVKMPDMDGFEVCRRLKSDARTREIPVLFISALGETAEKVKGFEAGGLDYILKPFNTKEVLARVACQLRLKELTDHLEQTVRERTRELTVVNLKLQQEIDERRRNDALNRSRSHLMQFSLTHPLDELLEETLSEAETLTSSCIGFYHFVEEDQKTLSLQTWSSRTKAEFCKAKGKGLHYDIAQAGVWVDCVYQRKPVIHNDYISLPHRKGMPEGHAPVNRELVVPVIRNEKITAILGIGNKSTDYNQQDVKIISLLAELAWEIAERKQAETALQRERENLSLILEFSPIGMLVLDENLNIIRANAVVAALARESATDMLDRQPGDAFGCHHSAQDARGCGYTTDCPLCPLRNGITSVFSGGANLCGVELSLVLVRDETPQTVWLSVSAESILMEGRKYVIAALDDITGRKQAEERLRETRHKLTNHLQNTPIGAISWDIDYKIVDWNPAAETIFGYTKQEILGRKPSDLILPEEMKDVVDGIFQDLISGKGSIHSINENITKDGRRIICDWYNSALKDADGKIIGMASFVNDITEQKLMEKSLAQAQKMESVGRLAGGVAHDYNNALTAIMGFTELAMMDSDPEGPLHADLNQIIKAGRRAQDITRQLLAFARKQTIAPIVLNLNPIVESIIKMLRRLIGEDIDLVWMPGKNLWNVKMDPSQIDQILANLCVNARDAIEGVGKITIETGTTVFDSAYCADHAGFIPGEFVLLAISDNGCGMDKGIQDNIFEPFFTTKDVDKGTGLGLSTVYGIVKQNNGFINVYSEPGKGTTIKIYLSRHEGKAAEIQGKNTEEVPQGRGETILVVEDDLTILELAQRMLEGLNYTVFIADTPKGAMKLAKEHTGEIHLLITDVIMPEMNGLELSEQLQSFYPDLKCIFTSGYTANAIAHHGVLDEVVDFIQKPFSKNDLAAIVRKVLDV